MNWAETIRTGLQAVRSHRLRSGLTVLGILIGIATVVLSVGLGEGTDVRCQPGVAGFTAAGKELFALNGCHQVHTAAVGGVGPAGYEPGLLELVGQACRRRRRKSFDLG